MDVAGVSEKSHMDVKASKSPKRVYNISRHLPVTVGYYSLLVITEGRAQSLDP